jgi:hypothetical protein
MDMTKKLISLLATLPLAAAADPLPKQVADMECLVGNWKGTGTMAMGKDKAKIDVAWSCKRTSGQFGVLCTARFTGIPGVPSYEETDLFGYEPNSNTYHWYAVTNAGETHDHVSKPGDSPKLEFVYTGTQEGKPFKETIALELGKDEKSLSGHVEAVLAGQIVAAFDIKAKKQ